MWTCPNCNSANATEAADCQRCGTARPAGADRERLRFQTFRGSFATWDSLFQDAADFASALGRERVLNVSHSEDANEGVVTVWYWE